ncbi:hypothetical protein Fmac_002336 [Flemingia macrophylla]|uniref:PA domain-containing protein n=1 Tax=Flemingia macrophylla TaxID=520843 RepID=A0ABD1NJR6_9FABA
MLFQHQSEVEESITTKTTSELEPLQQWRKGLWFPVPRETRVLSLHCRKCSTLDDVCRSWHTRYVVISRRLLTSAMDRAFLERHLMMKILCPMLPCRSYTQGVQVQIKGAENCLMNSLAPEKVKGKIVLCEQGETDEVEKGYVVKSAGGVGMVMANENSSVRGIDSRSPSFAVGFKAGNAIKEYLTSTQKPTATLEFRGTRVGTEPAPVVTAFSSQAQVNSHLRY